MFFLILKGDTWVVVEEYNGEIKQRRKMNARWR